MLKLVEQAPTFLNALHPYYGDNLLVTLFQIKSVIKMSQNHSQKLPKLRSESAGHNLILIAIYISCNRVTLHVSKIVPF